MEKPVTHVEVEPGRWLDARRAIWLEATRSLVVADLHWGYAASHRAAGNLLPVWGDDELAMVLDGLVRDYAPAEMIWLGDVIHAAAGRVRAEAYLRGCPVPVQVVRGNHDRAWRHGETHRELRRLNLVLHHGDQVAALAPHELEVVGHHHPAVVLGDGAGGSVRLPALVTGPRRWILPALSPWAAGAPWNGRIGPDEVLWAIAPRRVFVVPRGGRRARSPS